MGVHTFKSDTAKPAGKEASKDHWVSKKQRGACTNWGYPSMIVTENTLLFRFNMPALLWT